MSACVNGTEEAEDITEEQPVTAAATAVHGAPVPSTPAPSAPAPKKRKKPTEFVSKEDRDTHIELLKKSMESYRERMQLPATKEILTKKAREHEEKRWRFAKKQLVATGTEALTKRRAYYIDSMKGACSTLDRKKAAYVPEAKDNNTDDIGAVVRTISDRADTNQEYWGLLDSMRAWRPFAAYVVNGPIKKQLERCIAQPGNDDEEREQVAKRLALWQALDRYLSLFLRLCEDSEQETQ